MVGEEETDFGGGGGGCMVSPPTHPPTPKEAEYICQMVSCVMAVLQVLNGHLGVHPHLVRGLHLRHLPQVPV